MSLVANICNFISFDHYINSVEVDSDPDSLDNAIVKPKNSVENENSSSSLDPPETTSLYNLFSNIFQEKFYHILY